MAMCVQMLPKQNRQNSPFLANAPSTPCLARLDMSGPAGQQGHVWNIQGLYCPQCNQSESQHLVFYHTSVLILHTA